MARFYLMRKLLGTAPERVELDADDRDHALYLAEGHSGDADIELWDAGNLLAEMSGAAPHLWMVRPRADLGSVAGLPLEGAGQAGDRITLGQG